MCIAISANVLDVYHLSLYSLPVPGGLTCEQHGSLTLCLSFGHG